jgi:ribosomal protein S18 acetylase RimI-like enzyme
MGPNGEGRRRPPVGSGRGNQPDHGPPGVDGPAAGPVVSVGPAADADAAVAARLHVGQISEGFLSLLGTRFLQRLYRRIRLHPHSFLLMAKAQGTPVGFIAGSTDVAGLYRSFLWRDGVLAAFQAAAPLARGWPRVFETLRHGASDRAGTTRGAELLSVAVDPDWRGRGAGRLLVAAFLAEGVARGSDAAHVVVGADNDGAVALYKQAGFVALERFELHPGTQSLLMQWEGAAPPPSSSGTAPE